MKIRRPTGAICTLAFVASLISALAMPPATPSPAHGEGCGHFVNVPGLGPACRVTGGWRVLLDGGKTAFTHGPDLRRAGVITGIAPSPVRPACVFDPDVDFHGEVIYARSQERPNRYAQLADEIRLMVAQANAQLRAEAAQLGRVVNFRMLCSRGKVVVRNAVLPTPESQRNIVTVLNDLTALGYTNRRAKYWIWYDGFDPRSLERGISITTADDRPVADNANNWGPGYAISWGQRAFPDGFSILMHEVSHTLGAVQNSAPHSTGGGHCTDGPDIMCYNDSRAQGSPRGNKYNPRVCAQPPRYDCSHNDYFNPRPSVRNYLYDHWNIGSPLNRFVEGCAYFRGNLPLGLAGQEAEGLSLRTYRLPSGCGGHAFALSGFLPTLSEPLTVAGSLVESPLNLLPVPDFNVCWYKGSTLLRCDTASGSDVATVPAGTTLARVVLFSGANAEFVLSVI